MIERKPVDSPGAGRLAGKVALVTGAASGIGREIAKQFAGQGASLVLADLNAAGLESTDKAIDRPSTQICFDVTDETGWRSAAEKVRDSFGGLDVLVNCAGISPDHDNIEDCPYALWRRIVEVNLSSVFLGCQVGVELMKENGGSIINLGSIRSVVASPATLTYSTTKSGLLGLTRSVALYCAEKKYSIRANAICPGAVTTEMHEDMLSREIDPDRALQKWKSEYPLGRLGSAAEVASLAVYLASDESGFVTGAHFLIDGGFTAQ